MPLICRWYIMRCKVHMLPLLTPADNLASGTHCSIWSLRLAWCRGEPFQIFANVRPVVPELECCAYSVPWLPSPSHGGLECCTCSPLHRLWLTAAYMPCTIFHTSLVLWLLLSCYCCHLSVLIYTEHARVSIPYSVTSSSRADAILVLVCFPEKYDVSRW